MSNLKRRHCEKRKKCFSIFEEEESEKDFETYSENEKKQFFKMLLKYNSSKKSTEHDKENESSQELTQKIVSEDETFENSEKSSKLNSKNSENKKKFKMEFSVQSNSQEDQEKKENLIMDLNNKVLREVLEQKWYNIEMNEGSLEELLNWNSQSGFQTCFENEDDKLSNISFNKFFHERRTSFEFN